MLCFPITPNTQRTKLQNVSTHCVFIGYSTTHKGYKCRDLSTGRITISRHVIFDKNTFPFQLTSIITQKQGLAEHHFRQLTPALLPSPTQSSTTWADILASSEDHQRSSPVNQERWSERRAPTQTEESRPEGCPESCTNSETRAPPNQSTNAATDLPIVSQTYNPRRSDRTRTSPAWMKDYDLRTEHHDQTERQNLSATVTKSNIGSRKNLPIGPPKSRNSRSAKPVLVGFPNPQTERSERSTDYPNIHVCNTNLTHRKNKHVCNLTATGGTEPT